MFKQASLLIALASFFATTAQHVQAADDAKQATQVQQKQQVREPIYGYRMMTDQERDDYRARMRNAKSAQERDQIRAEHHEQMQQRAKEKGITLPDQPPAKGTQRGGGRGPGTGMGPGAGMGPGGGMGPGPGVR